MTSDYMPRLTYFFPWSLVAALLVAVVFAIIGILIYKSATKKDAEEHPQEKHHPLLEKCKTYLARFGIFPADPLPQSFSYALKMMRTFIGGTQSQYQLPWVLMLGGSNVGKSTIVQNLDLDRPIDQPHFEGGGGEKTSLRLVFLRPRHSLRFGW